MSALRSLLPTVSLAASLACSVALAHPFHNSYAEIAWSSDSTRLEIALRVIPEDLEAAMSRGEASSLRHEVLFDEDKTQRNQTRRLWQAANNIMVFTAERPEQALWLPDDAAAGGSDTG